MKKIALFFILVLLIIYLALVLIFKEEGKENKELRIKTLCIFQLKKIGKALIEYCEKEGKGIYYPPNLEILFKKGYLKDKKILYCGNSPNIPYYYISGLESDMPFNIPILIETNPNHSFIFLGKKVKGSFVLFLDFTIKYIEENQIKTYIKNIEEALKLKDTKNINLLKSILEDYNKPIVFKSIALWRLYKLKKKLPIVSQYLYFLEPTLSNYAAFVLFDNKEYRYKCKEIILKNIHSYNYFRRKINYIFLNKKYSIDAVYIKERF